jgi:RNA methyltransferase, TrmH family
MSPTPRITSRQNPRIKEAVKLRARRGRQLQSRFLIDGAREIGHALSAGVRCLEAFICEELCSSPECRRAVEALQSTGAEQFIVSPTVYAKLAFGDREDGVIAVADTPKRQLENLKLPPQPIVAVMEGIEKPGNMGAILRSADAAGIDAVIVANAGTDLYNPNTIRASLGTVFRENVIEAASAQALAWLQSNSHLIVAARPDADTVYTEVDLSRGAAIVLGSEANGLSSVWSGAKVTPVRLPMHGLADSLNVSTTAAILFYEALRQRGTK